MRLIEICLTLVCAARGGFLIFLSTERAPGPPVRSMETTFIIPLVALGEELRSSYGVMLVEIRDYLADSKTMV